MLANTDKTAARRQEYFEVAKRKKDQEVLLRLMASEDFRWFFLRLIRVCKIYQDGYTGDNDTFRNEGMRRVGLMLLKRLEDLGMPGLKLKQLAEIEHVNIAERMLKEIMEKERKDDAQSMEF